MSADDIDIGHTCTRLHQVKYPVTDFTAFSVCIYTVHFVWKNLQPELITFKILLFFTIFLFFVCKMLKWEQKIFRGKSRDETYLHVLIPGAEDAESQSHLLTSADNIRCFDCHEETTCCIMLHKPMVLALNQRGKFIHSTMKYKVGQW